VKRSGASSYSGSVVVIHQALQSYGVNADEILRDLKLDVNQLRGTTSRVPEETYDELVSRAVEASDDPAFGLRYADFCHPTSFSALGLALLASETLRDFCERWVRYFALINTNETVEFGSEGSLSYLADTRHPSNAVPAVERAHEDAFLALVVKYIRLMYRPDYIPARVTSIWPRLDHHAEIYRDYFGVEPVFESQRNAVYIAKDDLYTPLPAANAALARQNDQVVVEFLAKMNKVDLPSQVNRKIIELLPSGDCSNERIAASLNMSVRALYNKLNKAGTSYQELLDNTREQLAYQYMLRMEMSISEIAYLLGFTDCSNFSRAFRRWSGQSPSEFRGDPETT
jgi:AraC-like DNA-binding protein